MLFFATKREKTKRMLVMKQSPVKLLGIFVIISLVNSAWSDFLPGLPGSVEPAQVGRALQQQQPQTKPNVLPPVVTEPKSAFSGLSPEAQKIKFRLNKIIIEGNHVFSDEQLSVLWKDKLHKTITISELFNIVQSITNFYRNAGYILSRAILPPQHVKGGVVRIRVIEGYIDQVTVQGQYNGAYCMVEHFGQRIKECPPLFLPRLERYLLLTNEIPATAVRAVLTPSKTKIGGADIALVTQNKPITGYVSYDNYGTRYIGPQQMTGNIALNSWVTSGDATNFTITKTPKGGELTYTDLNWSTPVDDNGTRWLLGWTRVHTHPLFVLGPADIDGLNSNYYTNLYFPTLRTRTQSLTWRLGLSYLDSDVEAFDQRLYMDHIRPLDFGASWNFSDNYLGTNLISGDIRQGLPILGYTSDINPATAQTSRPGGRGEFTKIAIQLTRLQLIDGPWSVFGVLQGQWAFQPLLASEQFVFGGPVLGRGYDIAELIGDKGAAGSVELRYDMGTQRMISGLQFYAFYDAGIIWNFKLIGGVPRQLSASSAGTGVRFTFTKWISGNLMWAQPLTKKVAAELLAGNGWRPRVFFSVVASFL